MKLLGRRKKGRPKKISMDVVKEDMKCVCVTEGIGGDGGRQPAVATPKGSSQKNKKKLHIVIMLGYSSFARLLGAGRHLVSQCFVISTDMHCALYKCCVLNTLASTNPHWVSSSHQGYAFTVVILTKFHQSFSAVLKRTREEKKDFFSWT